MPYDLTKRLVVGISSSALFNLDESDQIFRTQGEEKYREYQRENQDITLGKGVAFPQISKMLCKLPWQAILQVRYYKVM